MVIKEGYKQTEIGMIPNDWEVKSYDEVFYFLNTAAYSRAELTELDEIKYIHYGDIHTKFNYHLDVNNNYLPSIPQSKLKNYSLLKDGDVIMADASEDYLGIGKSIEIKNLVDKKIISGLHTFLFRDKNDYFINGYKGYIHSINVVKKQFDSLATGMKVYGVSKNNLKKILIPIPTLAEQTAIATALSDADGLITGLEKLIAKKRNIKQGAMQQLLHPKEDWEMKKIQDLIDENIIIGHLDGNHGELYPRSEEFKEVGLPYIGANDFVNGKVNFSNCKFLSEDRAKQFKKGIAIDGDVLFAHNATVGPVAFLKTELKFVILSTTATYFRCNNQNLINSYLFYALQSTYFTEQYKSVMSQSTRSQVPISQQRKFNLIIPSPEEQTRIATILSDMDAELSALEQKLEKYKKIKLGMMQELLTGKTRLV